MYCRTVTLNKIFKKQFRIESRNPININDNKKKTLRRNKIEQILR